MQISRPDRKTLCLTRFDAFFTDLLRRIPQSADPGDSAAARDRLFSPPSHDDAEADFADDWRQYVEPDLQQLFLSNLEVIEQDLQKLRIEKTNGQGTLSIPIAHLENWIHGLNQARLALSARFHFEDEDMEPHLPLEGNPRGIALLQVRLYGFLQELFLRELEDD